MSVALPTCMFKYCNFSDQHTSQFCVFFKKKVLNLRCCICSSQFQIRIELCTLTVVIFSCAVFCAIIKGHHLNSKNLDLYLKPHVLSVAAYSSEVHCVPGAIAKFLQHLKLPGVSFQIIPTTALLPTCRGIEGCCLPGVWFMLLEALTCSLQKKLC